MKLRNGKTYYIGPKSVNFVNLGSKKLKNIESQQKREIKEKLEELKGLKPGKKRIDIDKRKPCTICNQPYKIGDKITTCSIDNINKHSYHYNCFKQAINPYMMDGLSTKYNSKPMCPYCYKDINKKKIIIIKIVD